MTNFKIISRAEAKIQGLKHYFTGKPCKRGHVAERRARNGMCAECNREQSRNFRAEPEFREREREHDRKYQRKRREDPEFREYRREYDREYVKNNRALSNANRAKRKAAKLRRTPAWADLDLIEVFYATAREMTEATGIPHEVDHVVPLRGKNVSGLHVATNLQILTKSENCSKGNKYDGDN